MGSERRRASLAFVAVALALAAACSDNSSRQSSRTGASPVSPSPVLSGPAVNGVTSGASAATASKTPAPGAAEASPGRTVTLPAEGISSAFDVAFPGRDESFAFRQSLEAKYRDALRRQPSSSYVDVEGDLVWTQEYLRYRVNACGHADATQRVLTQIDGAPAPPVCGSAPSGAVAFPPRDESFVFRQELERKYRDGLRRSPSATYVDVEGSLVWTQEYLRYRVNACGHTASTQKVMDQIDGRGIAPTCYGDLSGVWDGVIFNYFNSPFVADIVQTGSSLSGTYQDRHDRGSVDGSVNGDRVQIHFYFGDTGMLGEARWDGADYVNGDIRIGGGIGMRSFEMRRRR